MAIVNQIYNLVNAVSADVWGTAAPSVKNLAGLIALGQSVGADGSWTADSDKFLGALVDRIGKSIIRTLDRRVDLPNFIMHDMEFGAILQKIDVQPIAAQRDSSWAIGDNDFSSDFLNVYKPNVSSTLFSTFDTWTCKTTIPDVMFKTAFTSAAAMGSFITAIMDSLTGSIESQINKMNHICLCNFFAEKAKNSNNGFYGLVTAYNTAFGYTSEDAGYLTPNTEAVLYNKDFVKFATRFINNMVKYLGEEGTRYNVGDKIRATARDNMHCIMLTDFASSVSSYLESDTYHNELVSLPYYDEVTYWQYTGDTTAYRSGVTLIPSSEAGQAEPTTVTLQYIVGCLLDRQALGTTIKERWSASDRINSERRTNYVEGVNCGWFNDLSENGVIFTLG